MENWEERKLNQTKIIKDVDIIFTEIRDILIEKIFKLSKCFVGETIYGEKVNADTISTTQSKYNLNHDSRAAEILNSSGDDFLFDEFIMKKTEKARLLQFFFASLICHPSTEDSQFDKKVWDLPLIEAANKMGFVLTKRTSNSFEFFNEHTKHTESFEILLYIPFNSLKRKNSIIIKSQQNGIYIFTHGISEAMVPITNFDDEESRSKVHDILDSFKSDDLRSGMVTVKNLTQDDLTNYLSKLEEANKIEDFDEKYDSLNEIYNEIETKLNFIGLYSLDFSVKHNVAETFDFLMKSAKKIWILSSSWPAEIINVAKKTGLLSDNTSSPFNLIDFTKIYDEEIENQLDEILNDLKIKEDNFEILKTITTKLPLYLLVSNNAIEYIFNQENLAMKFMKVCIICKSVFGYRLPPKNKMALAQKVKQFTNSVTLSIGSNAADAPIMNSSNFSVCLEDCDDEIVKNIAKFKLPKLENLKDI